MAETEIINYLSSKESNMFPLPYKNINGKYIDKAEINNSEIYFILSNTCKIVHKSESFCLEPKT